MNYICFVIWIYRWRIYLKWREKIFSFSFNSKAWKGILERRKNMSRVHFCIMRRKFFTVEKCTHTYTSQERGWKRLNRTEPSKKETCYTILISSCECNELARLCMNFIFILIINTNLMKFNNILVCCGFLWFRRPKPAFLLWNSVQCSSIRCVCVEKGEKALLFWTWYAT